MKKAKMMLIVLAVFTLASGALAYKNKSNHFGSILYEGPYGAGFATTNAGIFVPHYTIAINGSLTGYYTSVRFGAATQTVFITYSAE
jgi:hypothetical protein